MENSSGLNRVAFWEKYLPGGILLAAFLLRLIALDTVPLTEHEAGQALQALAVSEGAADFTLTQPLYVLVTAGLFSFFDASVFLARLFPALAGFLLICLPLFFSDRLESRKKLLLLLLLAVDPATLAWGKTADALIPVLCLLGYAGLAFSRGKQTCGVILLALAMTGGERFWPAAAAIGICALVIAVFSRRQSADKVPVRDSLTGIAGKRNLLLLIGFWLLFSVGLFGYPAGLNAVGQGLLRGFFPAPGHDFRSVGFFPWLWALFIYLGAGLIFFLFHFLSIIRLKNQAMLIQMSIVILFGLLLLVFRQGILVLPWLSLPVYYFAADGLFHRLDTRPIGKDPFSLLGILIPPALGSFLFFRAAELLRMGDLSLPLSFQYNGQLLTAPLTRLQGYLIIMLISILIFGIFVPMLLNYFSPGSIRPGIIRGCLIVVAVGTLTNTWAAAGLRTAGDRPAADRQRGRHELVLGSQINQAVSPLADLVHEIGVKQNGFEEGGEGVVTVTDDPMLRWELRKNADVRFSRIFDIQTENPSYVITEAAGSEASLPGYVGMPVDWKNVDDWRSYSAVDWLNWTLYRSTKDGLSSLHFWQRTDWLAGSVYQ